MLNKILSKLAAEQPIDPAALPQAEEMHEAAETPAMEAAEHAPGGYEEGGEGSDQLAQIEQMIAQLSPEELQQLTQELAAQEGGGDETAGLAQAIEGHLAETPEASVPEAPAEKQAALSMVKSASYIQGFIKHAVAQGADVSEAVDLYDSALTHAIHDLKVAALHGKQTKLDIDNDGKIEASDLAKLRASGKNKEKKAYYTGVFERAMEYGLSEKQAYELIKQANPGRRGLSFGKGNLQPDGSRSSAGAPPEALGTLNPMLNADGRIGALANVTQDDGKLRDLQSILQMKGDQSSAIDALAGKLPLGSSATGEEPSGWLDGASKLNLGAGGPSSDVQVAEDYGDRLEDIENLAPNISGKLNSLSKLNLGAGESSKGLQLSEDDVNSATPGVSDYLQASIRNLKGKAQDLKGEGGKMLEEALAKGKDYVSNAGQSARDFLQSNDIDPSTALALGGGALAGAGGYGLYHYLKNKMKGKESAPQASQDMEPKTAAYYDGVFERAAEYGLSVDETIKLAGFLDTVKNTASDMYQKAKDNFPKRQGIPGTPGVAVKPARLPVASTK